MKKFPLKEISNTFGTIIWENSLSTPIILLGNDTEWTEFSFGTAFTNQKNTWPFTLTATGNESNKTDLNASGKWHAEKNNFFVHLGILSGHIFEIPYELTSPSNIYALHEEVRHR